MDFYARVGFRFLALPAWADSAALSTQLQEFRSLLRVDAGRARARVIATIREEQLSAEMVMEAVSRLESPCHRFLAELFWPHVAETEFAHIRKAGSLASQLTPSASAMARSGSLSTALAQHSLALSWHCQAIEAELRFLEDGGSAPTGMWEEAIRQWRIVCTSDAFWNYLTLRVEKLDDPRMRPEDVKCARTEMPRIILGVNELFAERYSAAVRFSECARHLKMIMSSGFAKDVVEDASAAAVRRIAGKRLEQLLRRAAQAVESMPAKMSRDAFEKKATPLLEEAREIQNFLAWQLEIPEELLAHSSFDALAETLLRGLDKKLDYNGEQRERNFVYASVFCRRILTLPLSGEVRRRLEQSLRENCRFLYSRYGLEAAKCPDASQCFFVEGAEADPDASQIVHLYRITERRVELDHHSGSFGVRVSFESGRLIIPRSKTAATATGGKAEMDVPESQYTQEQRESLRKLKEMEAEHRQKLAQLGVKQDEALHADDRRTRKEVAATLKESSQKAAEARHSIEREEAEEARILQLDAARLKRELHQLQAVHGPGLLAARSGAERLKARVTGAKGYLMVELPAFIFIFLLLREHDAGWISVLVSAVLAIPAGQYAKVLWGKVALMPARRAESASAAARAACERASTERAAEIRKASAQRRAPYDGAVAEAKRVEDAVRKAGERRREQTLTAYKQKLQAAKDDFDKRANHVRIKLRRIVNVKGFSSRKNEFPPYKAARDGGYREGQEPSTSEMEPTDSERMEARMQLLLGR